VRPSATARSTRELADLFLADCKRAGLHAATLEGYRWALKPFAEAFPTMTYARELVLRYIRAKDLSPTSLRNNLKVIRTFYRWGKRELGYPELDLSRPMLPAKESKPHSLSQEEIHQVLHACRTPFERAVVILLAQTGARRGGVCTLRKQDLADGIALVREKMGTRILYLPDEAWKAVHFAMNSGGFLSPSNTPMEAHTMKRVMHNLLKRAGVHKVWMGNHAFRHSFSAEFVRNGGPQRLLPVIMGHAASDMTGHYTHLADHEALAAARQYAPRRFLQCSIDCPKRQAVAA
jgi:integrase